MRFETYYSKILRGRRSAPPTRQEAQRDFDAQLREVRRTLGRFA